MKKTLAFAIVTSDATRRSKFGQVCSDIGRRLDAVVYPQLARTYNELADGMMHGRLELAWTPPLIAAELVDRGCATVGVVSRRDNSAHYRSVLFARSDTGLATINDLQDAHVAWVDETSASGYIVPRAWLRDNGHPPDQLFSKQSFFGTHGRVAQAVLEGRCHVGATFALFSPGMRTTVQSGWMEIAPQSETSVRIIANTGSVPADCISFSNKLDPDLRKRIEQVFLSLDPNERANFRAVLGAESYERPLESHKLSLQRLQREAARSSARRLGDA